jgi:hypothetical protein
MPNAVSHGLLHLSRRRDSISTGNDVDDGTGVGDNVINGVSVIKNMLSLVTVSEISAVTAGFV